MSAWLATRIVVVAISLLSLPALLGGCASTTSEGAVGSDRKQLLLVSPEQMDQVAVQAYTQLKSDAAAQGTLNKDPLCCSGCAPSPRA